MTQEVNSQSIRTEHHILSCTLALPLRDLKAPKMVRLCATRHVPRGTEHSGPKLCISSMKQVKAIPWTQTLHLLSETGLGYTV